MLLVFLVFIVVYPITYIPIQKGTPRYCGEFLYNETLGKAEG